MQNQSGLVMCKYGAILQGLKDVVELIHNT